jgi:uncharacterized membrane protein YphA (DoxX/SURF4 family)
MQRKDLPRLLLAAIFLVSAMGKSLDLSASAWAVHAYDLLPPGMSLAVGTVLPALEAAIGAALLLGFWTEAAALWALALGAVFAAGNVTVWIRGTAVDCHCFGELFRLGDHPAWALALDGVILGLALSRPKW